MTNAATQVPVSIKRRRAALLGLALGAIVLSLACASPGKSDWFGPSATPACDLARLPDPPDVPPVMPAADPQGGSVSILEISLQTRVLDGKDHCEPGQHAPVLGGIWDIQYNITSDGLPFVGTGPNPYNGAAHDPAVWFFRVTHGRKNQIPPLVRVDFQAKFSDGLGQRNLPASGVGAALIVRINGGPIRSSIAYPMKGGDYLRIQLDPTELAVYFP
jgi:hypothetical protein